MFRLIKKILPWYLKAFAENNKTLVKRFAKNNVKMQYDYLEALVKDLSLYKIKTEINMKNLRIWQTLSLFILLLSITLPLSAKSDLLTKLNTITLIIRTQSLETSLFAEKYFLRGVKHQFPSVCIRFIPMHDRLNAVFF